MEISLKLCDKLFETELQKVLILVNLGPKIMYSLLQLTPLWKHVQNPAIFDLEVWAEFSTEDTFKETTACEHLSEDKNYKSRRQTR